MVNNRQKYPDIIPGNKYGRLTAIVKAKDKAKNRDSYWVCKCECGADRKVAQHHLKTGHAQSCGCIGLDRITKHNRSNSPTYKTWENMISRCFNSRATGYHLYGGRGISVCERWRSFESFFADMGERPKGKTLDRINTDGNYEPNNCRWLTVKEQANNTRRNRRVQYEGQSYTLAQLSELTQMGYKTLQQRLDKGMSAFDAVHVPLKNTGWRAKRIKEQSYAVER